MNFVSFALLVAAAVLFAFAGQIDSRAGGQPTALKLGLCFLTLGLIAQFVGGPGNVSV